MLATPLDLLPMGRRTITRLMVGLAGAILIALGMAGIVLPILPGWALIIAGLLVLRREFDWAERTVSRLRGFLERRGLVRGSSRTP